MLHLEEVTGILYSNQSLKGVTKDFILTVRVSDGINTDEAEVKLTVQAVNQHQPKFVTPALSNATVEVPEVKKNSIFVL
jgi:malonyl CoA-acyl carrier protein transacylase